MPYRMSQDPFLHGKQDMHQSQKFMLSKGMQQALKVLQLPLTELSLKLEEEIDLNPILEMEDPYDEEEQEEEETLDTNDDKELQFSDEDFSILSKIDDEFSDLTLDPPPIQRTNEQKERESFLEMNISNTPSLYEFLMSQATDTFNTDEKLGLAEILIGYIDEHGFLKTPLKEIAKDQRVDLQGLKETLLEIQTFDPPGVGAKDIQECFLIQLRRQKKENSIAYTLIEKYFDELTHNHIPVIHKKLKIPLEELNFEIEHVIAKLDKHPGLSCSKSPVQYILPDVKIEEIDGVLEVSVNHDTLPPIRMNHKYLKMLKDPDLPQETKAFIEEKIKSAKWLLRILDQRDSTLLRIVKALVQHDKEFFLAPEGNILPRTMKMIADEIGVHESTVARAVQNKYISCARGTLPLRAFFTSAFHATDGEEVSSTTIKNLIVSLTDQEDKEKPLSDEKISQIIHAKGIPCARRTVAKFRQELKIGNRHQRRKY